MPSGSAESHVQPAGHFSKSAITSLSAFGRGLRLWGPVAALILLCIGFGVADPGFATIKNSSDRRGPERYPADCRHRYDFRCPSRLHRSLYRGGHGLELAYLRDDRSEQPDRSRPRRCRHPAGNSGRRRSRSCERSRGHETSGPFLHGYTRHLVSQHGYRDAHFWGTASDHPGPDAASSGAWTFRWSAEF